MTNQNSKSAKITAAFDEGYLTGYSAGLAEVGAVTRRRLLPKKFAVIVIAAGVVHISGYDKKALSFAKDKSSEARTWLKNKL